MTGYFDDKVMKTWNMWSWSCIFDGEYKLTIWSDRSSFWSKLHHFSTVTSDVCIDLGIGWTEICDWYLDGFGFMYNAIQDDIFCWSGELKVPILSLQNCPFQYSALLISLMLSRIQIMKNFQLANRFIFIGNWISCYDASDLAILRNQNSIGYLIFNCKSESFIVILEII